MESYTINIENNIEIEIQTDGKRLFWIQTREDGSKYSSIIYQADYIDLRWGDKDFIVIFVHHNDPISENREDTKTLLVKFDVLKSTVKHTYRSTRVKNYGSWVTEDTGIKYARIVPIIYDFDYAESVAIKGGLTCQD